MSVRSPPARPALGLRPNLAQFALLVGVNGLVGALVGQERTLVPLLGRQVFSVHSTTAALLFIATFGAAKALANLAAGFLADRYGRKPVLVGGWLVGAPVPLLLMWAPAWAWVVAANVLLGINQGLTWSSTVVMKIDLAGPKRRGLAMGLNEFAGYLAVALSAAASGAIAAAYGLRPEPLFLGLAIVGLGLGLSAFVVKETSGIAALERDDGPRRSMRDIVAAVSGRDRTLGAISRTGLANNANDAYAWGIVPLLLLSEGLDVAEIGLVAGVYPAVWGIGQLAAGAWSDRVGRRLPIAAGMWVQAAALAWLALGHGLADRVQASALLGIGTALTYPTLLAAVGDRAARSWRAAAVGVYRTWRDAGYVVGALIAGVTADLVGSPRALLVIAAITAVSGADAWLNVAKSSSDDLNAIGWSDGR